MKLKVWAGLLVSAVLLGLSARNVDFERAWHAMQSMQVVYLIPYAGLITAEIAIRAWKWQVLLAPTKRCSFWRLSKATLIGLMANNVLPARAGEFVRAYAGARLEGVPYSTMLATVVIDRVLDGLTVSAIFVLVILFQPLPDEIKAAGYLAAAIYFGALVVLIGLITRERATMRLIVPFLQVLPAAMRARALGTLAAFVQGLHVFRDKSLLLLATLISFAIWLGYALSLHLMFLAFAIDLNVFHALVVLLILTIVLTLPSSPGFVGAMEWAITFGLGIFGVSATQAFALAIVYHVTQYVPITLGGIILLWTERLSMAEIARAPSAAEHE